jgi:uncharacterized protein
MNNLSKIECVIVDIAADVPISQLEAELTDLDLNDVGIHGRTPLMIAATKGLLPAVKALINYGASVHAEGIHKITALHEASANGEAEIVEYLLSLGAEVNGETTEGVTPLMSAAAWGHIEIVRLLLDHGADSTKADHSGATAGEIAEEKGEEDTANLIYLHVRSLIRTRQPIAEAIISSRNILLGNQVNEHVLPCLLEILTTLDLIKVVSTKMILSYCVKEVMAQIKSNNLVSAGRILNLIHNLPLDEASENRWNIDYFLSTELSNFLENYEEIKSARFISLYVCGQLARAKIDGFG